MAFTFKHGDRPLEGYVIQRGVGRGGFGEVYYAVSDSGREVALKYLRENPAIELRGVSHCMNLKSPHLVTIFDVKQNADGEYFIIMEYVQGPSLRDVLIAEPEGLGPQKAAFFIRELAKGLGYLHDRGIVHRDMKPGNIFYEDGYVKIGDYGLSKFISVSRHSAQTASVGTVHYMAPEIGSGNYHRGIDIYALGVMLYEMLLGRVPYEGDTMGEVLMKHLMAQPEVDDLPEPFGKVIHKALAKDPKDRYQTVDEMAEDLLGVDEVQKSLAGFNPRSLAEAARAVYDPQQTPVPSPNPTPPPPGKGVRIGSQTAGGLVRANVVRVGGMGVRGISERLAGKANRAGKKVARHMRHLDRGHGHGRGGRRHGATPSQLSEANLVQLRHYVAAIMLVIGIAIALGIVTAVLSSSEVLPVSAGFGVVMMSAGVLVSRKVTFWLGQAAYPDWVRRLVMLGCAGPLLAVAMAPLLDNWYWGRSAMMVLVALIATTVLVDWEKRFKSGASGEMKVAQAFSAALCALIFTSILTQGHDVLMFMAAGVAGATSFALQGVAWFAPLRGLKSRSGWCGEAGQLPDASPASSQADAVGEHPKPPASKDVGLMGDAETARSAAVTGSDSSIPMAIPVEQNSRRARLASPAPLRHVAARAFWSVVGFGLMAGAVVSFLSTILLDEVRLCPDTRQGVLTIFVACWAMLLGVALPKTRIRKQPTFWRETLRPFLASLMFVGMGASVVAMVVQPSMSDGERLVWVSTLVLSFVLFVILLFARRALPDR
ncbi:MAG: serine/threonine protein kinase [Phycisphaerae bacterium]|nr:serine/threonine protein kinase [Phycisphaerae bacterium]